MEDEKSHVLLSANWRPRKLVLEFESLRGGDPKVKKPEKIDIPAKGQAEREA